VESLQNVLRTYFEDVPTSFGEDRDVLSTRVVQVVLISSFFLLVDERSQVPFPEEYNDLVCYLIFFGSEFLLDPYGALDVIKVVFAFHAKFPDLIFFLAIFFFGRGKPDGLALG
jgi:hypothetical protein